MKPKEDMQIPPKQARSFEQGAFLVQDDSAAHYISMLQVIMGYDYNLLKMQIQHLVTFKFNSIGSYIFSLSWILVKVTCLILISSKCNS